MALTLALVWSRLGNPEPGYRTLSSAAATVEEGGDLRLVFAADTPERALREAIRSVDANIVGGPSALGVYTLRLSGTDLQTALDHLRQLPSVHLAEPVTGVEVPP